MRTSLWLQVGGGPENLFLGRHLPHWHFDLAHPRACNVAVLQALPHRLSYRERKGRKPLCKAAWRSILQAMGRLRLPHAAQAPFRAFSRGDLHPGLLGEWQHAGQ